MARLDPDIASFHKGVLTYKSLILTLWAKDRLGLAPDLSPIDIAAFKPFFKALFAEDPGSHANARRPAHQRRHFGRFGSAQGYPVR
jgi:hypothetical protein